MLSPARWILIFKASQYQKRKKRKKVGDVGLAPVLVYPVGFFYGAATKEKGGARV